MTLMTPLKSNVQSKVPVHPKICVHSAGLFCLNISHARPTAYYFQINTPDLTSKVGAGFMKIRRKTDMSVNEIVYYWLPIRKGVHTVIDNYKFVETCSWSIARPAELHFLQGEVVGHPRNAPFPRPSGSLQWLPGVGGKRCACYSIWFLNSSKINTWPHPCARAHTRLHVHALVYSRWTATDAWLVTHTAFS